VNKPPKRAALAVIDLARVVYSSGKVFDGLNIGRLDTENFLRSGSLDGISSRSDLALLEDLRDVAQYVIDNQAALINVSFVRAMNAQITRSGPLHPGAYRTDSQAIGVNTAHGRHTPKPSNDLDLQRVINDAMSELTPRERALELFVQIAKAQPFEDGNKRTALFVANSLLIREPASELLVVPVDMAPQFNEMLAKAYVLNDAQGVKALLRTEGFTKTPFESKTKPSPEALEERYNTFPALRPSTESEAQEQGGTYQP